MCALHGPSIRTYCVACCFCLITMWFPFVTESYKFFIASYPATNAKKLSVMHASCIFIMIKECHAFPCVHARKNLHHFFEQIDEFHMRYKTIKTNFNPRRCELRTRLHFTCSLPRQTFVHELTNYSLLKSCLHTNLLDTQRDATQLHFFCIPVSFLCRHWLSVWYTLTVHRNRIKYLAQSLGLMMMMMMMIIIIISFFKNLVVPGGILFILKDLLKSRTQNFSKVFIKRKSQYQYKIPAKALCNSNFQENT